MSVLRSVECRVKIIGLRSFLILLTLLACSGAKAQEFSADSPEMPTRRVLSTSGASGGLNIPDGKVVAVGAMIFGFNNNRESEFSAYARSDNYQFAMGLAPYFELSGRLANIPLDKEGTLGVRDLSANLKFSLPRVFRYQPSIAVGINDLGGGAPFFKSKYVVMSETVGPLSITVGSAHGKPYLSRAFAGVTWDFASTGMSLIAERNSAATTGGARYASGGFRALNNASLVLTAQRSFGAKTPMGEKFAKSSIGLNLYIPLGNDQVRSTQIHSALEPIWVQPEGYRTESVAGKADQGVKVLVPVGTNNPAANESGQFKGSEQLVKLRQALVSAGLERVRVGVRASELVVEFENHRYNRNESDAIGVVLGLTAMNAPEQLLRIVAVTKKAGLPLYGVSVDRAAYRMFIADGISDRERLALEFSFRPSIDTVQWNDPVESERGYSRIRVDPSLNKFVGTDVGVFDYSLAANIQGFIPLWKGAEIATSYYSSLAESDNVKHGIYGFAQQRSGLKSAVLSQSFWIADNILGVANIGKFMYDDKGIQIETVYLNPNRDDQFRLKYTHLRHPDRNVDFFGSVGGAYNLGNFQSPGSTSAGGIAYLLNYQPMNVSVDASYNKYVAGDRGPTLQVNRWFGDVQAQIFLRRSNLETKIGFGLAFPLTPRQGMNFGLSHLEGAGSFPLRLETRYARQGQCNCITNGIVQEMPLVYSSNTNLLNQGRIGREYLLSQLQRMREAAFLYANLAL
jgi:hypothetical protein